MARPRSLYNFYQEKFYSKEQNRNLEGVMSTIKFLTPTGLSDFPVVTDYIQAAPSETWFNNIHN